MHVAIETETLTLVFEVHISRAQGFNPVTLDYIWDYEPKKIARAYDLYGKEIKLDPDLSVALFNKHCKCAVKRARYALEFDL